MPDPDQRHPTPSDDRVVDRDVRIEQLLLSGLDHYFRAQFERAIDVWTRVLFLDREHPRARAYIERARAAVAERLRESEAFLHAGVEACDRGDVEEARALLNSAIERGGAHDTALSVLERVDRLESAATEQDAAGARRRAGARRARRSAVGERTPVARTPVLRWLVATLVVAVASVAVYRTGWSWTELLPGRFDPGAGVLVGPVRVVPETVPIPSAPELALERAEALAADGRYTDALDALSVVAFGDRLRTEVDEVIAELQRALLDEEAALAAGAPAAGDRARAENVVP